MTQMGASIAYAICAGWIGFALADFFVSAPLAALIGVALGLILAWPLRGSLVSMGAVAIFAPFGVTLPTLAIADMAAASGLEVPGFSNIELVFFLFVYLLFLAASFGLISIDIYRLGYHARAVGLMTLALCLYAGVSGNWVLALVAVGGQAIWAFGWSSSNWFDTVLHVVLVPVTAITLIIRVI